MKHILFTLSLLASATGLAQTTAPATPSPNQPPPEDDKVVSLEKFVITADLDKARENIAPSLGASSFKIDRQQIEIQPQGPGASFNQVILRVPGAAQDSFGQLHLRGEHANLQYRLNDVLLPEGLSGFGQELDTRFIESATVLTGTLPAQFGYRTAGIVDIHTKNGSFLHGTTLAVNTGSHDTFRPSIELGGARGDLNYYVTASYDANSLGIENPTPGREALHDHTRQFKLFGYASTVIDHDSRLSLIASATRGRFEIPNNPGQAPAFVLSGVPSFDSARLDERQHEDNAFLIAAYQRSAGAWDMHLAAFLRESRLRFFPDRAGDLIFNGVASAVDRHISGDGLQADFRWELSSDHTLRSGLFATGQRSRNHSSTAVFPVDANGDQASLVPLDISDAASPHGSILGVYLQDEWRFNDRLTVNYGARADASRAFRDEGQLSPRLNAVYRLSATTDAHAGYARYFTPPPLELVQTTDLARFAGTTNAPAVNASSAVASERSHYFDAGFTHRLTPALSLTVDAYLKIARQQLDEGQFGQALIFSPFNFDRGRVHGLELSANYSSGGFSTYANFAISRATARRIVSGEFQFDPDELAYIAAHDVFLDHDQRCTASAGVSYRRHATTVYLDVLYGSGLRRGFANTEKLPAYAPVNLGFVRKFKPRPRTELSLRLDLMNVFDRTYLLRDGSGIGAGAPQYGARRSYYGGATWSF